MRLWIGINLSLLPLETYRPCWTEPGLFAVIDREVVLVASHIAIQSGVRIGMRRASATAVTPNLVILTRNISEEQAALDSVALALLQYTPEVTFAKDDSILLDVTASLSAFGGRLALCRRVRSSMAALGFTAQVSCAPTAQGAWLLARYAATHLQPAGHRRALKMSTMTQRLDSLPCMLLPAARPHHEWLQGIGCLKIGDLRKLPRAGLQRRTNTDLLRELDQAYGLALELFEWVKAPEIFDTKLDMPDRIEHAEALLFSARRLIVQMVGWLVARQQAVSYMVLWLVHERGRYAIPSTPIDIRLGEPTWQEEHIIRLLKELLSTIELIAPVMAIRLETKHLSPMLPASESLFPEPGGTPADFSRLLELLKARLGEEGVLRPVPVADYRPEVSNHWEPAMVGKSRLQTIHEKKQRPSFLLAQPIALLMRDDQPFYGSPLRLIQGPERIEAGWWDGALVVRDYFVAQGSDAVCYWVYQERTRKAVRWFLHGLFA